MLRHFHVDAISTKNTALMSKVLWEGTGIITLPINEPAAGGGAPDPARPGRGRLLAADLHPDAPGPAHGLLRVHRTAWCDRVRQGQLQGTLRGHRARARAAGQPLTEIVEVGPRDGLQSEEAVLSVPTRGELI